MLCSRSTLRGLAAARQRLVEALIALRTSFGATVELDHQLVEFALLSKRNALVVRPFMTN